MLRLSVDFTNLDTDKQVVLNGATFPDLSPEDQAVIDAVQAVVDNYEDQGITIDQGGSTGSYELNLPDGFYATELAAAATLARALLHDVEVALSALVD